MVAVVTQQRIVRLLREWKKHPAGRKLRMSDELARWLIGQGIATDAGTPPYPKPAATPTRRCCGRT